MSNRYAVSNAPVPEEHLLAIAVGVVLHRVRPSMLPGPRRLQQLIGWSLIAAGTQLAVRSMVAASEVKLDRPDRLVTSGPYAVSRNPMYVGWALIHLGAGVAAGSRWVMASLPAAIGLVHREIRSEEQRLGNAFGETFDQYRATVPRYLPHIRRNTHAGDAREMGNSPEASVAEGS